MIQNKEEVYFSVIMPTYNQSGFIRNAIRSLFEQTYTKWELIIVNDGCTDNTEYIIQDYLRDKRITYLKNMQNEGIGLSINKALDAAKYDYIAYLPSDDFYFKDHLQVIKDAYAENQNAFLIYTRMKSELSDSLLDIKNLSINGLVFNESLQLVQTSHKKNEERWVTRDEYITSDLYSSFWYKLTGYGQFVYVNRQTCNWTIHLHQRHSIMDERHGGNINRCRLYYHISRPIRMRVSENKFVDEVDAYNKYRKEMAPSAEGLKILIVGELSYNPERIFALEEAGHRLYGLWTKTPRYSFSNVGHLPFGNVKDLYNDNWKKQIEEIRPDIIYALLNISAVKIAHEVMNCCGKIPFVWHFKEGPFMCLEHGLWNELMDLYTMSDGQIFLNEESKMWYEQYMQPRRTYMYLDGDLPKKDIFSNNFSHKLSEQDGEIHTVVAGRMIGIDFNMIKELSDNHIHIHLYNESYEDCIASFIRKAIRTGGKYFHVHPHCSANNWVKEFSKYDAGWLHCMVSNNYGDVSRMGWNDMNLPARLSTMMAAAVPCIMTDNSNHIVAMQNRLKSINCGIFFQNTKELIKKLKDKDELNRLQRNARKHRMEFTFDAHVAELISFFRTVIKKKSNEDLRGHSV